MSYTRQYKEFLRPELRIGRASIKPLNIYRISIYYGGYPMYTGTVGDTVRYIFVLGRIGNKIHCLKLNDIVPLDFTNLLFKLREKRVPIGKDQRLSLLLKHFSIDGKTLFEQYIKKENKVYGPGKNNYRIYKINKIAYVWEIRFDDFFLRKLFKEESTPATREPIIKEEINKADADDSGNTINSPR